MTRTARPSLRPDGFLLQRSIDVDAYRAILGNGAAGLASANRRGVDWSAEAESCIWCATCGAWPSSDKAMKHKRERFQSSLDQITVADLVRFLLWLPADEREKVIDLLRAIQDRRWHEVWLEPTIVGEAQE